MKLPNSKPRGDRGTGRAQRRYFKAKLIVPLKSGRRAYVKVYDALGKELRRAHRRAERERICLEVLEGLAVPRLLRLPKKSLSKGLGFAPAAFVAQSWAAGTPLPHAGLRAPEVLGVWMFVTEQLVAFRRHQVLYADIKASNILATRVPLSATVTVFDRSVAASAAQSYPSGMIRFTAGYQAPEHGVFSRLTERSVVYQLGMLWARTALGWNNADIGGTGLRRLLQRMRRIGGPDLTVLIADCLAPDPSDRPANYEEVLERINACRGIPSRAARAWNILRAPYAKRLASVGLSR